MSDHKKTKFQFSNENLEERQVLSASVKSAIVGKVTRPVVSINPSVQKPVQVMAPKVQAASVQSKIVPARSSAVSVITSDITTDTTFKQGTDYIIDGEIHVRAGVTLTIENDVTILIRNGYIPRTRLLDTSALIFDSGSKMQAQTVHFRSADANNKQSLVPLNGGVFFCGSTTNASKDGVIVDTSKATGKSSFVADRIDLVRVGRTDPNGGDGDDQDKDDIDAISLLGLGEDEWSVSRVLSYGSGDDGFDVTNSTISLDFLLVDRPIEDGVNLSSSFLKIHTGLTIKMGSNTYSDRELFDFEVDDGPSRLLVHKGAYVNLKGYWGGKGDREILVSSDMPPSPAGDCRISYCYKGKLKKGPAFVYALSD